MPPAGPPRSVGRGALTWECACAAQVAHVIVRLFGALVLGQSWLVWHARKITDGEIRRAFVQVCASRARACLSAGVTPPPLQAYFGVFTASTVALLRSHLTDPYWHPVRNPVCILCFGFLAVFYGWFALLQKPVVFEGLPKTVH